MTSRLDSPERSVGDRRRRNAYLREFVPGMAAYAVVLVAAIGWGGFDGTSPWRFVWAALPVLPMIWVAIAVLRHLRRVDGYQRERLLSGLSAGFAVAMLAAVALGILGTAGFDPEGSPFWIYGAGMLAWLLSAVVPSRG